MKDWSESSQMPVLCPRASFDLIYQSPPLGQFSFLSYSSIFSACTFPLAITQTKSNLRVNKPPFLVSPVHFLWLISFLSNACSCGVHPERSWKSKRQGRESWERERETQDEDKGEKRVKRHLALRGFRGASFFSPFSSLPFHLPFFPRPAIHVRGLNLKLQILIDTLK